jgi:Ca2+-binding RTX toxin-like protein
MQNTHCLASLEPLESRRLLSVTVYNNGGTLYIEGDANNNWISVSRSGGLLWVNIVGDPYVHHFNEDYVYDIHIRGGAGNDTLAISPGITEDAEIWGGPGADYIVGGGGYNDLYGHGVGTGIHDEANDDNAADILVSGQGDSDLWGQGGNDHLYTDNYAVSGTDLLAGGDGNDTFYTRGHDGFAYVVGEAGNDKLIPYESATQEVIFSGGSGASDRVDYRDWNQAIYAKPDGSTMSGRRYGGARLHEIGSDVETIDGTDYGDHFSGTSNTNAFFGWGGNDYIFGHGGADLLVGGDGDDHIWGGDGNDVISGNDGNDTLRGEDGNDTIRGNTGNDTIYGGAGNDSLYGDEDHDTIHGDAGNDLLVGGHGSDVLWAWDGVFANDVVYGDNIDGTGGGNFLDVAYLNMWQGWWDPAYGVESITFGL